MTSEGQLSLFPECGDQCGSPLHGLESVASELADFANAVQAKVGDLVFLEVGPDRLYRIEFRRVGWKSSNGDVSVQFFEPCVDLAAAMSGHAVPDDQQWLLDLTLERGQEFDDLLGADGTREKAEVEVPEGQTGNGRKLLPGEAVLEYGRMSAQAPGARD